MNLEFIELSSEEQEIVKQITRIATVFGTGDNLIFHLKRYQPELYEKYKKLLAKLHDPMYGWEGWQVIE